MNCIHSHSGDPYFNLAMEEYLLRNKTEDFFLLYRNEPSVIVGKHQNASAEINWDYVFKNNIKIARRLSGGGTVYHDRGNLNFSFIKHGVKGKLVDFKKHTAPIRDILLVMGLETGFEGNNSITLKDMKISGNAEHIFKNRLLHHGTLLFSTDLEQLNDVLGTGEGAYSDKAVKSVRAEVTNISDYLLPGMTVTEFEKAVMIIYKKQVPGSKDYYLSAEDKLLIETLKKEKYETNEWIFSYSPHYKFDKQLELAGKSIRVVMEVEKGEIRGINISGDFLGTKQCRSIELALRGEMHRPDVILKSWNKNVSDKEFVTRIFF